MTGAAPDLEALVAGWRSSRDPVIADRIEELGSASSISVLDALPRATTVSAAEALLPGLEALPDDPRITVKILAFLAKPRWPSSGGKAIWDALLARLVTLRDARAIRPLRAALATPPQFVGIAHGKKMVAAIAETLAALERACPGQTPTSAWLGGSDDRGGANAEELLAQVWANPDDDDTRRVVADALADRGDPWGELIHLGLQEAAGTGTIEMRARAETLLHKHATHFGGPLAHVSTKDSWRFEKGFLVACVANRSMQPRRRWEEAAAAPHWATVTELAYGSHTPRWWLGALLGNTASRTLRTIRDGSLQLARSGANEPWTLHYEGPSERTERGVLVHDWAAVLVRLPPEVRARLQFSPDLPQSAAAILRAKLGA